MIQMKKPREESRVFIKQEYLLETRPSKWDITPCACCGEMCGAKEKSSGTHHRIVISEEYTASETMQAYYYCLCTTCLEKHVQSVDRKLSVDMMDYDKVHLLDHVIGNRHVWFHAHATEPDGYGYKYSQNSPHGTIHSAR